LSFVGFVVMLEAGRTFEYQLAVNGIGFALMGSAAWWLSQRKGRLAAATGESAVARPVRSDEAGTR
jgi:hypothetical protein